MSKFEFTEDTYKKIELSNGLSCWEPTGSVTHKYDWQVEDERIIVNEKWMKIEKDFTLSYALYKTKIKSYDLEEVLHRLTKKTGWRRQAHIILSWIVEHGKEVQK